MEPDDDSKKETVRINLPPGLTGRQAAAPAPGGPQTVKLKPAAAGEDDSKRETAVMGRPVEAPKPMSDMPRVQVTAARPVQPETPRPTVKIKQPEPAPAPAAPAPAPAPAPAAAPVAVAAAPSGAEVGFALASIVLSLVVTVYLAMVAFG
ncbi:MAG: hypothetical protein N3A53_05505 [Verrucomicrobiae bacterium]|nr:hypothetical protein [Verrucomicrobiae bacterium]